MDRTNFLEYFRTLFPEEFKEEYFEYLPDTFRITDFIPIYCEVHGIQYRKACTIQRGTSVNFCPRCGNLKYSFLSRKQLSQFIKDLESKYGKDKYRFDKTIYRSSDENVTITCLKHGDFKARPNDLLLASRKSACVKCSIENRREETKERFIELATKRHNGKFDYSKVVYKRDLEPVEIICPIHGSFFQRVSSHLSGKIACIKCSRENNRLTTDSFIERARKVHGDFYDYSKANYTFYQEKLTITCPKHGDFDQTAAVHLKGGGCPPCSLERNTGTKESFEKEARKIHGDRYDYSKSVYLGNKVKLEIICREHGSFWLSPNAHLSCRQGCMRCRESKGETKIRTFLTEVGLPFKQEYKLEGSKYRYDFYIPGAEILIEYHGKQHYEPVEIFGGQKAFEELQFRDAEKVKLAFERNKPLITLSHESYNKGKLIEVLISELRKMYKVWYLIDGKLLVFKDYVHTMQYFGIPGHIRLRDVDEIVLSRFKNSKRLFLRTVHKSQQCDQVKPT